MYEVSHQLYLELAERLVAAIGKKEFFSGSVSCIAGDVELRLVCTLIVQRSESQHGERTATEITGLVPIWWECHATEGSDEIMNDFSFRELLTIALN